MDDLATDTAADLAATIPATKRCPRCRETRDRATEYYRSRPYCKLCCQAADRARRRAKRPPKPPKLPEPPRTVDTCTTCNETKPVAAFVVARRVRCGYTRTCKPCHNLRAAADRAAAQPKPVPPPKRVPKPVPPPALAPPPADPRAVLAAIESFQAAARHDQNAFRVLAEALTALVPDPAHQDRMLRYQLSHPAASRFREEWQAALPDT